MKVVIKDQEGVLGTVSFEDGKVNMDEGGKRVLKNHRVIEAKTNKVLRPSDGEQFMRALPYNLTGSYVYAHLEE